MTPRNLRTESERMHVGERFSVSFQRTLRVPEDGGDYPLPPSFGTFTFRPIEELGDRAPRMWRDRGGFYLAMYQHEAMWLGFGGTEWKPNAVQVLAGGINALSGVANDYELRADEQNYMVCPDQPWLDGFNAGDGVVRQFVAVRLGAGRTAEAQLTGEERRGGLELRVYEPRTGIFPEPPPPEHGEAAVAMYPGNMGLGAGGTIRQRLYRDPHGVDTWDPESVAEVAIRIIDSGDFQALTGEAPPPSPVGAAEYARAGLPWFELEEAARESVPGSPALGSLEGVVENDTSDDVNVDESTVHRLNPSRRRTHG